MDKGGAKAERGYPGRMRGSCPLTHKHIQHQRFNRCSDIKPGAVKSPFHSDLELDQHCHGMT